MEWQIEGLDMTSFQKQGFVWMSCVALVLCAGMAAAEELATQGRAVLAQHESSLVTVQLVVKQKFSILGMGGEEDESKLEVLGTVIDPTGLTVISLSASDPTALLGSMMGGMMPDELKMDSSVGDVKILLPDRTEVEASVVLRDREQDLAFVRPKEKPAQPWAYVDLKDQAQAQVLDPIVMLTRMQQVANRVSGASLDRIRAVVEKPRTFYVLETNSAQSMLGAPVYTLSNKVLGICVMRAIKSTGSAGCSGIMCDLMGAMNNMAVIVCTAEDVLQSAEQAPAFDENANATPKAEESGK